MCEKSIKGWEDNTSNHLIRKLFGFDVYLTSDIEVTLPLISLRFLP